MFPRIFLRVEAGKIMMNGQVTLSRRFSSIVTRNKHDAASIQQPREETKLGYLIQKYGNISKSLAVLRNLLL